MYDGVCVDVEVVAFVYLARRGRYADHAWKLDLEPAEKTVVTLSACICCLCLASYDGTPIFVASSTCWLRIEGHASPLDS